MRRLRSGYQALTRLPGLPVVRLLLLQARYLQLVPPQQLPAILKTSLTAPLLAAVAATSLAAAAGARADVAEELQPAHAAALLEQLVAVPRFDMTAMCLTRADKAALAQAWDAAAAGCGCEQLRGRLGDVRARYRV